MMMVNITPNPKMKKETINKFKFLTAYNPSQPVGYSNNLREMMSDYHLTYELLSEIHDGKFDINNKLFTYIPNVSYIIQSNEAYQSFQKFMQLLRLDYNSLQNPQNLIRKTYNNFQNDKPQIWRLIDPEEYLQALKIFSTPKSGFPDNYWSKKIFEWEDMAKENVQQLAANSYLTSGPELDPRRINGNGENTFYLLWYNLSGDEKIPYKEEDRTNKEEYSKRERYFNRNYWIPFTEYIGTSFGDVGRAFETDSTLNPIFNLVAEFERNKMEGDNSLLTLNRLIDIVHGRGTLSYLFVDGDY